MPLIPYKPSSNESPATAVYVPFALGGTEQNNKDRLQAIANASGFVLGAEKTPYTTRIIIDRAERRSLPKTGYRDKAKERAETIRSDFSQLGNFTTLHALGDSGRGLWVTYMQSRFPRPFNAITVRQGVNQWAPESLAVGGLRLLQSAGTRGPSTEASAPPARRRGLREAAYTLGITVAEAINLSPIVCGTEATSKLLIGMADNPDIVLHNVIFSDDRVCGPRDTLQLYNKVLANHRAYAANELPQEMDNTITARNFLGTTTPGFGHGNLLDPSIAVQHLLATHALLHPTAA